MGGISSGWIGLAESFTDEMSVAKKPVRHRPEVKEASDRRLAVVTARMLHLPRVFVELRNVHTMFINTRRRAGSMAFNVKEFLQPQRSGLHAWACTHQRGWLMRVAHLCKAMSDNIQTQRYHHFTPTRLRVIVRHAGSGFCSSAGSITLQDGGFSSSKFLSYE